MSQHPDQRHLPDLRGSTVIVTGADGGLGQGIVRRFALARANVVIHHRSPSTLAGPLAEEVRSAGGQAVVVQGDVRRSEDCRNIADAAVDAFGGLSSLVNNAGVQPVEPLDGMTLAQWEAVIEVNLSGTFAMSQAAADAMKSAGGSITHIASVEASLPAMHHAHYAASKAGVKMHARAAALELGHLGIRVNSVSPGLIDAGQLAENWPEGRRSWLDAVPLQRTGTPEDIGDACVFLASPLARWISGHDLVVDGGMSAVPAW